MTRAFGKIQVYSGDGKGKTTAALGLAMRALGRGKRVIILFFDKGGTNYGERKVLDVLGRYYNKSFKKSGSKKGTIEYFVFGLNRIHRNGKFRFGVTERDKREGERGLRKIQDVFENKSCDLLILDEINTSLHIKMISLDDFIPLLKTKPKNMEIVCTGRKAPKQLRELADLVTEMKMRKHYFYNGVKPRSGIEY